MARNGCLFAYQSLNPWNGKWNGVYELLRINRFFFCILKLPSTVLSVNQPLLYTKLISFRRDHVTPLKLNTYRWKYHDIWHIQSSRPSISLTHVFGRFVPGFGKSKKEFRAPNHDFIPRSTRTQLEKSKPSHFKSWSWFNIFRWSGEHFLAPIFRRS